LTFEEKKTLISSIHALQAEHMERVVEIIQASLPANTSGNDDELEIPLDELDTLTLRKLQKFVDVRPFVIFSSLRLALFIVCMLTRSYCLNTPMCHNEIKEIHKRNRPMPSSGSSYQQSYEQDSKRLRAEDPIDHHEPKYGDLAAAASAVVGADDDLLFSDSFDENEEVPMTGVEDQASDTQVI
jgi:Bromodomain extra-terminal - transcription regulation